MTTPIDVIVPVFRDFEATRRAKARAVSFPKSDCASSGYDG